MTTYSVSVQGKEYTVEIKQRAGTTLSFLVDGEPFSVSVEPVMTETRRLTGSQPSVPRVAQHAPPKADAKAAPNEVRAPIPGIVSDVKVSAGSVIEAGAMLVVIEAMKMENPIRSQRAGTIKEIHVAKGSEITNGALLVTFEP
jgi:biotin carboxyl carrier protein